MSELVNGIAVVGLVGIAGWLIGALLIPDAWAPRRGPRPWRAAGRRGWRRAALSLLGRVALRVALWAARRSVPPEPGLRCHPRAQREPECRQEPR